MQAYSLDLRQRILRAVDQVTTRTEIVKTLAVSRSMIKRDLKLRRETGDVKPKASEQNEADRVAWREQAKMLDESLLVFIDECGSNIALTPVYTRSPKGKRIYGSAPRNRRANITRLSSLSRRRDGGSLHPEGSADAAVFEFYVEQILAPSLPTGHTL